MQCLVVLPPSPLDAAGPARAREALSYHVGDEPLDLTWAAPEESVGLHSAAFPDLGIRKYNPVRSAARYDGLVYLQGLDGATAVTALARPGQRTFVVDHVGKLQITSPLTARDYRYLDTHVFNRLAGDRDDTFLYFPYGYLFRSAAMGPTNPLGHRVGRPLSAFMERPPGHKLVALFGGSAAWSLYTRYEQLFTRQVEELLNSKPLGSGVDHVSVLNFAQHGNVVLNEVLTYVLFVQALRPDVVIAHDGFNDLYYGQQSDPFLLNEHAVTYQYNLEEWSQRLHGTADRPLNWPRAAGKVPTINYPRAIVRAYRSRLTQFRDLVEGAGGRFVAALQPTVYSKREMSQDERAWLGRFESQQAPAKNITFLYERYLATDPQREFQYFLNLHAEFNRFDRSQTHFGDIMHTTPAGDDALGAIYANYLRENVFV